MRIKRYGTRGAMESAFVGGLSADRINPSLEVEYSEYSEETVSYFKEMGRQLTGSTHYDPNGGRRPDVTLIKVPGDSSDYSRLVRFHEQVHSRYTEESQSDQKALDGSYGEKFHQIIEDARIHTKHASEATLEIPVDLLNAISMATLQDLGQAHQDKVPATLFGGEEHTGDAKLAAIRSMAMRQYGLAANAELKQMELDILGPDDHAAVELSLLPNLAKFSNLADPEAYGILAAIKKIVGKVYGRSGKGKSESDEEGDRRDSFPGNGLEWSPGKDEFESPEYYRAMQAQQAYQAALRKFKGRLPHWREVFNIGRPELKAPKKRLQEEGAEDVRSYRGRLDVRLEIRRRIKGDRDPKVFMREVRDENVGGAVLLDCSGSMKPAPAILQRLASDFPGAVIAGYDGIDDHEIHHPSYVNFHILALDGKCVESTDRLFTCGGNGIDYWALQWLLEQEWPRFFITDREYTGPAAALCHYLQQAEEASGELQVLNSYSSAAKFVKDGSLDKLLAS